jgi:hypothetical protein
MINKQQHPRSKPLLGGLLIALIFILAMGSAGPWHLRTGTLALALGILMAFAPPVIRFGKPVVILAILFFIFGLASFLPAVLFGVPEWRKNLQDLGLETGDLVAIQWKPALEYHLSFLLLFLAGLWILGQRFSASATRNLVLTFVLAVAAYALFSKSFETQIPVSRGEYNFGFFPNRNHTSNLLSVGFLCGLGLFFQSVRSKSFAKLVLSSVAAGVILWAILSWNLSRSGIALSLGGSLLWLVLLGRRYFGKQELKVLGLVALLAGGVYLLSEFRVKDRIDSTVEKITGGDPDAAKDSLVDKNAASAVELTDLDFRVPIAIDTARMITDAPLSGVGAGQFRWVFPQYREQTISKYQKVAFHPESSWLWLAAELGIPAATCILILVAFFFGKGTKNIKEKNHRDRALRLGCLVAAALVPLHGIFDVPAHRPALFLAALLLYALSQNPLDRGAGPTRFSRWSSLALALVLIAVGIRLLGTSSFGWTPPHSMKAAERLAEGVAIYERVSDFKNPPAPFESLELRKKISTLAERSVQEAPLDGRFYRLSGLALLPLDFEREKTAVNFEIDRALTPYSVSIPLLQASSALFYNPAEVKKGWTAAVERAKAVDEVEGKGDGSATKKRVLRVIAKSVARNPRLKKLAEEIGEQSK